MWSLTFEMNFIQWFRNQIASGQLKLLKLVQMRGIPRQLGSSLWLMAESSACLRPKRKYLYLTEMNTLSTMALIHCLLVAFQTSKHFILLLSLHHLTDNFQKLEMQNQNLAERIKMRSKFLVVQFSQAHI